MMQVISASHPYPESRAASGSDPGILASAEPDHRRAGEPDPLVKTAGVQRPTRRDDKPESLDLLRQVPLFESLDDSDLSALLEITRTRTYARGDILCRQGDPGDDFVVILEGSVKVELLTAEGKELTLTILKSFQFFGELALFDDMPRSASVSALEDTRVMLLGKSEFHRMLHEHPRIFFPITRHLTRRLRTLTEDVASLAYLDAYSRVARKLWLLADQLGVNPEPDQVLIPQSLTHQELANLVGTTRETVTKILNDMKDRGLVSINQHRITLLRKGELLRALT